MRKSFYDLNNFTKQLRASLHSRRPRALCSDEDRLSLAILKKKWQVPQVKIAVLILAVEFVEVVLEVVVVVEAAHRKRPNSASFVS